MTRELKQVRFNLDLNKPDERALYEAYQFMKERREWQSAAIEALRIYLSLKWHADAGPLYKAFPHLQSGLPTAPTTPMQRPNTPGFQISEASDEDVSANLDNTFDGLFGDDD